LVLIDIFKHIWNSMFNRHDYINNIIDKLSFLKTKVELSNPLNLTDVNIISENFFRDLLNLVYGLHLENINKIVQNSAAIDLGDTNEKICIQVTSTNKIVKTRKTVQKFIEHELFKDFSRLVIFNIVEKSNHQEPKLGNPEIFEIDTTTDIWDIGKLLSDIQDKDDADEIKKVSAFLDKEIKFEPTHTVAKELLTFTSLISLLSDEAQPAAGTGFIERPDPDGKIYHRFEEHADFLTIEYQDLYIEYGLVLEDLMKQADIGQSRIRRLGLHLKRESDKALTACNNDPQLALEELTQRYETLLQERGSSFDKSAIRFFLLDQLIKCNVFPNKVSDNE
jgi:hypothetical protein